MQVRNDESGVLLNFEPSFNSVSTLAHELGHAYHNTCLAKRTPSNNPNKAKPKKKRQEREAAAVAAAAAAEGGEAKPAA